LPALTAILLALAPGVQAQEAVPNPKDPFVEESSAKTPAPASNPGRAEPTLSLTYEVFSLPIAKAGELHRRGLSDPDLYKELVATAKLERFSVLRNKSGNEGVSEAVYEHHYPTEYGPITSENIEGENAPPSAGQADAESGDSKKANPTKPKPHPTKNGAPKNPPFCPIAFEMRPTGDRLPVTATAEGNQVELDIKPEHVIFMGTAKHSEWQIERPQVGVYRMQSALSAEIGSPRLIGTLSPFSKNSLITPDISRKDQDIWFCFITPNWVNDTPSSKGKAPR
jgi:hypothetical protein